MNNTSKKTPMKFSERFHIDKLSAKNLKNFKWSKKKTAVTATAMTLALAMVVTLLPHIGIRTYAESAGYLTSANGANSIPDVYEAVNVPYNEALFDSYDIDDRDKNGLVAFDFHIFAKEFASNAHTCGNVAVENFGGSVLGESGAPEIGSREEHDTASVKMSYVENPLNWTLVHNDLVLGYGNSFTGNNGPIDPTKNNGQITLNAKNGKKYLFGNDNAGFLDSKYIDDSTPLIDIDQELAEAEQYQKYLVALMDDVNKNGSSRQNGPDKKGKVKDGVRVLNADTNDLFTGPAFGPGSFGMGFAPGGKIIDLKKYPEDTIIINFQPGETWNFFTGTTPYHEAINFLSGSVDLKGTTGKRVIINIDTTGWDKMTFFDTTMKADKLTNEENSVHSDNNILWNFYERENKGKTNEKIVSSDSRIEVGGTWMGSILAPDGSVYCRAGLNGSIIANKVATTAETHKSDYTGEKTQGEFTSITVKKNWINDTPDSRPEFITVKLYQDKKVYKTIQLTPQPGEENTDQWTYTFSNLPKHDKAGKTFKYKIEEIVPDGYTGSVYNYTLTNKSNNEAPKVDYTGYVEYTKKSDTGSALPGARLRLTSDDGANLSKVVVTGADSYSVTDKEVIWTTGTSLVKLDKLPYGKYTVTEVSAPAGYKLNTGADRFTLSESCTGHNASNGGGAHIARDMTNYPVSARFIKLEDQNHMALEGGTFELTSNWGQDLTGVTVDGAKATPANTGSKITFSANKQEITFGKIPSGSYTITETAAPEGYDIAAPITFIVDDNGNIQVEGQYKSRIEMFDTETPEKPVIEYGAISFNKKSGDSNLAGATFKLRNVSGKKIDGTESPITSAAVAGTSTYSISGSEITFTTESTAVQITNLLAGNYVLEETSAPAGYKTADPVSFTVTKDNASAPLAVTVQDEKIKGIFSKQDANAGTELVGAAIKITSLDGHDLSGVTGTITTTASTTTATNDTLSWTSSSAPNTLSALPAGVYKFEETTAPDGYSVAEVIYFKVDENGKIYSVTKTVYEAGNVNWGSAVDNETVVMKDAPSVVKIDKKSMKNGVLGGYFAGAVLRLEAVNTNNEGGDSRKKLTNVNGSYNVTHDGDYAITWTSGTSSQELRGLPANTYKLHEVSAPDGYALSEDITFTVAYNSSGNMTVTGLTMPEEASVTGDIVTMVDKKYTYHDIDLSKIELGKMRDKLDGQGNKIPVLDNNGDPVYNNGNPVYEQEIDDTPIPGAKFGIFHKDAQSYTASEALTIITTTGPESAQASVKLHDGDYVIVELEAPADYNKTNQKVSFSIVNGEIVSNSVNVTAGERATASHGNPKNDDGMSLDDNCFYTLQTTEIFESYGEFPSSISFDLDPAFKCDTFTLYKDDGETAVPVIDSAALKCSTNPEDPSAKKHYSADLSAAEDYDANYTYYAVLDIKNNDNTEADPAAVGDVKLTFVYATGGSMDFNSETGFVPSNNRSTYDVTSVMIGTPQKITLQLFPVDASEPIGFTHMYLALWDASGPYQSNYHDEWIMNSASGDFRLNDNTIVLTQADQTLSYTIPAGQPNAGTVLTAPITYNADSNALGLHENAQIKYLEFALNGYNVSDVKIIFDGVSSSANTELKSSDIQIGVNNETGGNGHSYIKLPNSKYTGTPASCDVKLTKKDSETDEPIPGTKFVLLDSNGDLVHKLKQSTAGTDGVYEYDPAITTDTINVLGVEVDKTDGQGNAYTDHVDYPLITGSDGKIVVTGLDEGVYTFREIDPATGYEDPTDPDTTFVLTAKHTGKDAKLLTVKNQPRHGELEFIKYDENRNPKAGAVFQLYRKTLDGGNFKTYDSTTDTWVDTGYDTQRVYQIYNTATKNYSLSYVGTSATPDAEPNAPSSLGANEVPVTIKTDQTGKFKVEGLELGYLYYAVEVTPAPGTEIPYGLKEKISDGNGGTTRANYSKPLPRLSVTKKLTKAMVLNGVQYNAGDIVDDSVAIANGLQEGADKDYVESHDSFYNIPANVTGDYATSEQAEDGLNYGIILADPEDTVAATKLFVLNTNQAEVNGASPAGSKDYTNHAGSPVNTGAVTMFNDSTRTTVLKTDENGEPLAGAQFKLTPPAPASAVPQLYGATSNTAQNFTYSYYAVFEGNTVPLVVSYANGAYTSVPAANIAAEAKGNDPVYDATDIASFEYVEEITWTSSDTAGGDIIYGLPALTGTNKYTVVETAAPDGYELNTAENKINAGDVLTVENELINDKLSLNGTKALSGRDLEEGEFSFTLTGGRIDEAKKDVDPADDTNRLNQMTVTNRADGKFTFSEIATFTIDDLYDGTTDKEFVYTLTENNNGLEGVTYDTKSYKITVRVNLVDGVPKAQIVGLQYTEGNGTNAVSNIKFTNKYDIAPSVTKTLNGRNANAEEFSFVLKDKDGNVLQTVKSPALTDGVETAVTFEAVQIDEVGEYTFTIEEVSGDLGGIDYDTSVYTWTVNVTERDDGGLSTTSTYTKSGDTDNTYSKAAFVNDYTSTGSASAQVSGTKTLTGKTLAQNMFSFRLTEVNSDWSAITDPAPVPLIAKNQANGSFTFNINYANASASTHYYTITEVNDNQPGVTYDDTVYHVVVEVSDNGEGGYAVESCTLTKADGTAVTAAAFSNEFKSVNISKKAVNGTGELAGAQLTLKALDVVDASGNVIAADISGATTGMGEKDNNAKTITWTSGSAENVICDLPAGYYMLKEVTAPDGYEVAEYIYFKVDENGGVKALLRADSGTAELTQVTSATFSENTSTTNNPVSGTTVTMLDKPISATISKQEVGGGPELPGATLVVKLETPDRTGATLAGVTSSFGDDAELSSDKLSITWESIEDEANELSKLPTGIYSLTEITAPNGYSVAEVIYFKVNADGTVQSCTESEYKKTNPHWNDADDNTVIMEDAYNTATISKQALGGGDELPGAKLTVKLEKPDQKGATLADVTTSFGKDAKTSDDKLSITWTSGSEPNTLTMLPSGVYSLTEVTAPSGYEVAETIYFKVNEDGTVQSCTETEYKKTNPNWEDADENLVIMEDAPEGAKATISKVATGGGSELAGAKLTVKLEKPDKTGDTLADVTTSFGKDAETSTDKMSITWTSGTKPNTLSKLPEGIYSLTEITAPEGYEVAEKIYFKVKSDGKVESCTENEYKKGASAVWTKVTNNTVIMEDKPVSRGPETTYDFSFTKKNSFDEALRGATFNLKGTGYDQTATSDANGKVSFTALHANQSYTLTETNAPEGYDKSGKSITVVVDENGNKTYKDFNQSLTLSDVEKAFKNKKTPINGGGRNDYKIGDSVNLLSELLRRDSDYTGKPITWRSSNDQIVSVDANGNATIKGKGTAQITAYYGDEEIASFVLGAAEDNEQSAVIGDDTVPNTRDMIIKYLKIASVVLVISTMIVLAFIYVFKRRKAAKAAH